jgi:Mrp family chromosome partitioning ATPase
MHVEIHRSAGMVGDFLAQETDQLRSRLSQTEDELRKAKAKAGVISVEDAKTSYAGHIDTLRQQIFAAQADRAQRESMLRQFSQKQSASPKLAAKPTPETTPAEVEAEVPTAVVDEYRGVFSRLEFLRKHEQELLLVFTAENSRVKDTHSRITELAQRTQELEEQHPKLARAPTATSSRAPNSTASNGADDRAYAMENEVAQLNAIDAKVKVLTEQMETLRKEAVGLDQLEGSILELTRKRELEEANYRRYSASLEQSRINEALGSGKVSNISIIQTPTPPTIIIGKDEKTAGTIATAGLGIGLVWAFLIELLLDRSVRRPGEIERMLKIPLFISIPKHLLPRHRRFWNRSSIKEKAEKTGEPDTVLVLPRGAEADSTAAELNPYFETLRDRLIGYFESRNLTHKPKLVALTGLGPDSGVTTMAAGLARVLSETGDGNVLLVDLTPGQGSAQYFHAGKAGCDLEELLQTRANAQVQERLFVASDGSRGDKLSRILPQRFAKLLPQLKSSDFDYIIFDMPPVSQISITPRLAGFMDMVLLVVESEKNSREGVQRATTLLSESGAHVGAVLNKTKTYVPSWLHNELSV